MADMSNPVISHAVSFLTGLVPLVVYLLTSQRKKLGYAINMNFEIVTVNKAEMVDRITILVDGKQTKEVRSTEITLRNIGVKDIQDQAIQIVFSPPAEIINSQFAYSPPGFIPEIKLNPKNMIELVVPLMNPGDRITIQCLTANNPSGACQVLAKGPNLITKRFNQELFVSPITNGIVTSISILIWLLSAGWFALRVLENPTGQPVWAQVFGGVLMLLLTATLSRILYEAIIRAVNRVCEFARKKANNES